jgi:Zn-dependent M28 family amino/carboxypeptidase
MPRNTISKLACLLVVYALVTSPVLPQRARLKKAPPPAPDSRVVLDSISANSLRGHLSFIASDLLEGRGTPSRGLDLAAEYIAAQFRRAGLEPAGDDGFFQTADWPLTQKKETPEANNPTASNTAAPPTKVRNVIGVLRGSDAALKDTYVLVTAHYDHLGTRANLEGDKIFNGANDDGSGTVSVIELAAAFAAAKVRPKRSLVFMTFFGEERGLLGSRYYGQHPIFPLEKTVAQINLEQVGRTDSTEGEQLMNASVTGIDFSEVGAILQRAGEQTGIKVYKHPQNSDRFFGASDNQSLADVGIPAHTICVAYVYPDYHKVSDHWDKVNYDNMAKVDRAVALAVWMIANDSREPQWNAANPKAARYLEAWKRLHQKN